MLDADFNEIAHKVDKIVTLLEGAGENAPGLVSRVAMIERIMFGKEQQEGLVYKVGLLWKVHVWVLCTLSAGAGFALREIVRLIWKV